MTAYVPVLKGKPGEVDAWSHASSSVIAASRPLLEVVPSNKGQDWDITKFAQRATATWPQTSVLTVDTGYLDQTVPIDGTASGPLAWLSICLNDNGVIAKPVLRPGDHPDVLAEAAAAAALHRQGACLRIGSGDHEPDPEEASAMLSEVLDGTGFKSAELDLVIDLWAISSQRAVVWGLHTARAMLQWASESGPWASVAVVAGAFPDTISALPKGMATPIHRFDGDLFDQIVASKPPILPDFGDYGVNHPSMPLDGGRGPLPSVRYTCEREWQVYREAKLLPGHESFFTLCEKLVNSAHWPEFGSAYSWGDQELNRCAQSIGGAGTATQWRAYGTSHHVAHVVDRLMTIGVP